MLRNILLLLSPLLVLVACENAVKPDKKENKRKYKVEKVNRERCSFDLSNKLYLDRIDSTHDPEGYFKISSHGSENILQLFVFNSSIDVEEKLDVMQESLNTPDIFTATTIDSIDNFGNYSGKGLNMKGTYTGGVVRGAIMIFCYGEDEKGFLVIRQTISGSDTAAFNQMERSFQLK